MIRSKFAQRLMGLLLVALSGGFTGWGWYTALNEGYYYHAAAALFPALAVLGLAMILFPIDPDEFRKKHGVDRIQNFGQMPPAWKVLFIIAIAAGVLNWALLANL
jgi:hypothetical protein